MLLSTLFNPPVALLLPKQIGHDTGEQSLTQAPNDGEGTVSAQIQCSTNTVTVLYSLFCLLFCGEKLLFDSAFNYFTVSYLKRNYSETYVDLCSLDAS